MFTKASLVTHHSNQVQSQTLFAFYFELNAKYAW